LKKYIYSSLFFLLMIILSGCSSNSTTKSTNDYFNSWPEGKSPQEIGKLVAEHFVETPHQNFNRKNPPKHITYPEVCTWFGALKFAQATDNGELLKELKDRFEPLFGPADTLLPIPDHVDYTVFGSVPFELYIQTKDNRYLKLGKSYADKQWGPPEGPRVTPLSQKFYEKGFTWQTRMWIDDMFMITAVQTEAYRATKDEKYVNRAAKEMAMYLDSLQQPNGLFYHAPDVPFFWGRGDGWMASGMSLLLQVLPSDHPDYQKILAGYKKMMATLLKYQDKNGMWHQLIDKPGISWPETSCSAMFTFAFISGVKNGWLEKDIYGPASRNGWIGLQNYIDKNGDTHEVCEGTNKKNDMQYYLDRKRNVGDMHGQAPVLWCAAALLK
jgi:unsaturated rhamnogalacturonyl hydrolase